MSSQSCFLTTAPTTLTTTAETAVQTFTVAPYALSGPTAQGLYIDVNLMFTTTLAATAATVRIRQGTGITGALVGAPALSAVTASTANSFAACAALDQTLQYPSGNTYTVTLQMTGASGTTTMQQVTTSVNPASNSLSG